jgi:hypothetical protein
MGVGDTAGAAVRPVAARELRDSARRARSITGAAIPAVLFAAATLGWIVEHGSHGLATAALQNALVYGVGVGSLIAAVRRFLDGAAQREEGREPERAFRAEIGVAYVGLGLLGIACAWPAEGLWAATIAMALALWAGRLAARVLRALPAAPPDGAAIRH